MIADIERRKKNIQKLQSVLLSKYKKTYYAISVVFITTSFVLYY